MFIQCVLVSEESLIRSTLKGRVFGKGLLGEILELQDYIYFSSLPRMKQCSFLKRNWCCILRLLSLN